MSDAPETSAGAEVAVIRYASPRLIVEWRPSVCTHSGRCVAGLPQVFNPARRPWIDMTAADAEVVAAQVARCPSGALRAVRVAAGTEGETERSA